MFWVFKDPNHVLLKDPVSIMKEIMSWMFKDPIVKVAWFNFDCDHWNRKNWPKKIKFPQMNFFLQKQLITFSCTYYPLSFCKILKKFFQPIQSYVDVPFLGPKWPICLEQIFFGEKIINIIFIYLLAPFIVHNFKNILTADPELQGCAIYGPKMANLLKSELFSENLLIRLVPFIHAYLHA